MTDDEPQLGSGDLPPRRGRGSNVETPPMPEHVGALEALSIHLRIMERRARAEGDAFWEKERSVPFEATNFAFLLRSIRSLLLILTVEHSLLDQLRRHEREQTSEGAAAPGTASGGV